MILLPLLQMKVLKQEGVKGCNPAHRCIIPILNGGQLSVNQKKSPFSGL